jgi:carboxypeptidase PM20D1
MRTLKYLALAILALVTFMVARTVIILPSGSPADLKLPTLPTGEVSAMANNLSAAVRIQTISRGPELAPDHTAFTAFHQFLADTYPAAHEVMEREVFGGYSLMYRWPAVQISGQPSDKKPIAFAAHMDVVPVEMRAGSAWRHDPFAGFIDDAGVIWGRGTMDDKGMLVALMESVERLVGVGFAPDRDIYFLFGHDEELGGDKGAAVMAAALKQRGVQLSFLIDEGSAIVSGAVPGVKSPVALVSLGEKGGVTLKFSAEDEGGHSSAPKKFTAASLAAKAGYLVSDNPYPVELDEHLEAFITAVAPEMGFAERLAIANLWATRPLLADTLAENPTIAAFMHTTTAFTMMKAGTKLNVLPQYGEAVVNYRIHPRDTVEGIIERARALIGDERITITNMGGREATIMSPVDSEGYRMITETVTDTFGPIPIAPTLTVGGTDGRHYYSVADGVYRFTPTVFQPGDLKRMHGTNEATSSEALAGQVVFFENLIKKAAN